MRSIIKLSVLMVFLIFVTLNIQSATAIDGLHKRQNPPSQVQARPSPTQNPSTPNPSPPAPNPTNSNTTVSNSTTTTNSTSSNATSTSPSSSIFSNLPPPGAEPVYITMTTPTPQDKLQRIGRKIPFSWVYSTNFAVAPKYLNISAVPESWATSPTNQNYSVANMLDPSITSYVWDTSQMTNPELIESKYILYIYDERGWQPQNTGGPGRLQALTTFSFSMYKPAPYSNLSDYHCAECSAAPTSLSPFILVTMTPIIILIASHFYFSID